MARFQTENPDAIDIGQRYDIYVAETQSRLVVYRNAFFRGVRGLEKTGRFDIFSDYIEIEQSNGESVFVRRHMLTHFCSAGKPLTREVLAT